MQFKLCFDRLLSKSLPSWLVAMFWEGKKKKSFGSFPSDIPSFPLGKLSSNRHSYIKKELNIVIALTVAMALCA